MNIWIIILLFVIALIVTGAFVYNISKKVEEENSQVILNNDTIQIQTQCSSETRTQSEPKYVVSDSGQMYIGISVDPNAWAEQKDTQVASWRIHKKDTENDDKTPLKNNDKVEFYSLAKDGTGGESNRLISFSCLYINQDVGRQDSVLALRREKDSVGDEGKYVDTSSCGNQTDANQYCPFWFINTADGNDDTPISSGTVLQLRCASDNGDCQQHFLWFREDQTNLKSQVNATRKGWLESLTGNCTMLKFVKLENNI